MYTYMYICIYNGKEETTLHNACQQNIIVSKQSTQYSTNKHSIILHFNNKNIFHKFQARRDSPGGNAYYLQLHILSTDSIYILSIVLYTDSIYYLLCDILYIFFAVCKNPSLCKNLLTRIVSGHLIDIHHLYLVTARNIISGNIDTVVIISGREASDSYRIPAISSIQLQINLHFGVIRGDARSGPVDAVLRVVELDKSVHTIRDDNSLEVVQL